MRSALIRVQSDIIPAIEWLTLVVPQLSGEQEYVQKLYMSNHWRAILLGASSLSLLRGIRFRIRKLPHVILRRFKKKRNFALDHVFFVNFTRWGKPVRQRRLRDVSFLAS